MLIIFEREEHCFEGGKAWFSIRQKWLARSLLLMYKSTRSIDLIDQHISIHVVGFSFADFLIYQKRIR